MKRLKILLVDDHDMVRQGIRSILTRDEKIEEIFEAGDGSEALLLVKQSKPDVVVLDYEMPGQNGIEVARQLLKDHPDLPILLLTAHNAPEYIMEGISVGIRGYLLKETPVGDLLEAIHAIASGDTWFKGLVAETLAPALIDGMGFSGKHHAKLTIPELTRREKEITRLYVKGHGPKEIAEMLGISKRTVEAHKSNIFIKLQIKGMADLVRYAIKNKLVRL